MEIEFKNRPNIIAMDTWDIPALQKAVNAITGKWINNYKYISCLQLPDSQLLYPLAILGYNINLLLWLTDNIKISLDISHNSKIVTTQSLIYLAEIQTGYKKAIRIAEKIKLVANKHGVNNGQTL